MKTRLYFVSLLWFTFVSAETSTQDLWQRMLKRVNTNKDGFETQITRIYESTLEDVKELKTASEHGDDFLLLLWSHWVLNEMQNQDASLPRRLSWVYDPALFPDKLESVRKHRKTMLTVLTEKAIAAREIILTDSTENLEEHVRNLVRKDKIADAVAARDLFASFMDQPEINNMNETVDSYQKAFRPLPKSKKRPDKNKTEKIYFDRDNPACQLFLKNVHAVSSGHLGIKTTGIRVKGHPDLIGRRGLNVVAVHGNDLKIHDNFDTYRSGEESDRFANAIEKLPYGTVVVIAVHDDASRQLTPDAKAALRQLGASQVKEGLVYRNAYLLLGLKGLKPGDAEEIHGQGERVYPKK